MDEQEVRKSVRIVCAKVKDFIWKEGDHVECLWKNGKWYPAMIKSCISADEYLVEYVFDHHEQKVPLGKIRLSTVEQGKMNTDKNNDSKEVSDIITNSDNEHPSINNNPCCSKRPRTTAKLVSYRVESDSDESSLIDSVSSLSDPSFDIVKERKKQKNSQKK